MVVDSPTMEPLSEVQMLSFKRIKKIFGLDPYINKVQLCFVHPDAGKERDESQRREFVGMKQTQSQGLDRTSFQDKQVNIAS